MTKFTDYLAAIGQMNRLGNGRRLEWLFHCGMLFADRSKWWGDFGFRATVHEGIDITYFRTRPGHMQCFKAGIRIPAMEDGRVINICNDFLGRTLVVEPAETESLKTRIIYAYAHIVPENHIRPGQAIHRHEIIAKVCETRKNPSLPPHLHFSCFELERLHPPETMNWSLFATHPDVNRIHPLFL